MMEEKDDDFFIVTIGGNGIELVPLKWTRAMSTNCIETLKEYLADAIMNEDYDEAAELRDAIDKLK